MKKPDCFFYMMFIQLALIVVITGGLLNVMAIATNQGRMPVHQENYFEYSSRTHFTVEDTSEVNKPELIDRIEFRGVIYSIGDIIMLIGTFIMIITYAIWIMNYIFYIKNGKKKR